MSEPTTAIVAVAPNQDIEVLKLREEILKIRNYARGMVVKTPQDAKVATNDLSIISHLKKDLETKRKEFICPLQTYVKEINDAFKLISEPLLEADKAVRDKIISYKTKQDRLRREALEAAEAQRVANEKARKVREETGEIVEGPTEAPVEIPMEVSSRVHADLGTAGLRANWKYEVVDFDQLPDEYKVPDTTMLNAIAKKHHDTKQIPGIRFYNEPSLAVTTKKGE